MTNDIFTYVMRTTIDWPNQIVNFCLIVFSILAAFQMDSCASDRRETKLVEAHLAELNEETRFNLRMTDLFVTQLEKAEGGLDTLLKNIQSGAETTVINRRVLELLSVPSVYLRSVAYELLTTSGDIRLIDDFGLKRDIVSLYEYHEQARAMSQLLLDTYQERYFDHISNHFDLYGATPQPLSVYQDRRFVNGVSSYYYFVQRCHYILGQHRDRMQTFLDEHGGAAVAREDDFGGGAGAE